MSTILLHTVVALILLAWFVLSVINQFQFPWFNRVIASDLFSLIPYWTFFAPSPGRTDYHLIYRDRLPDGSITDWIEVDITQSRNFISFVWNPGKRSRKVLSDVAQSVARLVRLDPRLADTVVISYQYLLILNYLTKTIRGQRGVQRQFAIVETAGYFREGMPNVVLRSDFHGMDLENAFEEKVRVSA